MKKSSNSKRSAQRFNVRFLACSAACAIPLICQTASGALFVTLPDLTLNLNESGQIRSLGSAVSNDSGPVAVTGVKLTLQVEDGALGGTTTGPAISFVDALAGTIFQSNNQGNIGSGAITPQIFEQETLTQNGTGGSPTTVDIPSGTSSLGTVTFDTTGIAPGTYSYTFTVANGGVEYHTTGEDISPAFQNGTLTVVPEPSSYALVAGIVCLGWAFVSRAKKRTAEQI